MMPRWFDVKRVVVYGLVNSDRDHRDYAIIGEWQFDLYERTVLPAVQAPLQLRRTKKGRFAKRSRAKQETRTQYRDPISGRFVKAPLTGPKPSGIPDDDTIVADVLDIIENETGHRLFRTPGQKESGSDRVSIGIQHLDADQLKNTYTYAEFLRALRSRAEAEWRNR
jgi:hypothetical protein